mgnify:FL=1
MPWIDEDTLKAVNSGSWQSAPVLDEDEDPDTHPNAEQNQSTASAVSSRTDSVQSSAALPIAPMPEKESPEMAKLDELIQTLSEL